MNIPAKIRELISAAKPAADQLRGLLAEKRAARDRLGAESAELYRHPSDRADLEAALTAAIDRLAEQAESQLEKYLLAFKPSPDPEVGTRIGQNLVMHVRHPAWHATECPDLCALLLPSLLREAVPGLAERVSARMAAFHPAAMSLAQRQARIAELNDQQSRLAAEIDELEQKAKEAGLAIR